jgi:hypothetical protein
MNADLIGRKRAQNSQSRRTVSHLLPFSFSHLLLFLVFAQLSTFNPQLSAAATFTNNITITETNTTYEGQDIVISVKGALLTVDTDSGWRLNQVVPRALRIEYLGVVYHVMNRGDHREPIFRDVADHQEVDLNLCQK